MLKKGVAESAVINILIGKLQAGNLRHRLTIIDGYFLSDKNFSDTRRRISNILEPFKRDVTYLEIITNARKSNASNLRVLSGELHYLTINLVEKENFHDRFWIIDERLAFVVGTSINSFGNKHFFIQDEFLSPKDAETILSLYKE